VFEIGRCGSFGIWLITALNDRGIVVVGYAFAVALSPARERPMGLYATAVGVMVGACDASLLMATDGGAE
jgi:hypothetical protein